MSNSKIDYSKPSACEQNSGPMSIDDVKTTPIDFSRVSVLSVRQIKDGTGFSKGTRFVHVSAALLNVLGHARAVIEEGHHDDRDFQAEALANLNELMKELGDDE